MKNRVIIGFEENGWNFKESSLLSFEEEYIFQRPATVGRYLIKCSFYFPSKDILIEEEIPSIVGESKVLFDGHIDTMDDLKILNRMLF